MSPAEVIARAASHACCGDCPRADYVRVGRLALAALDAAGLAVVPKEPTRQMIDALRGYAQRAGYAPKTYRAMVAVEQATKEGE